MQINNFQGDVSDTSTETESLAHDAPWAAPLSNCEESQFVNFNDHKKYVISRAALQIYGLNHNEWSTTNRQLRLFQPVQGVQLEQEESKLDFSFIIFN